MKRMQSILLIVPYGIETSELKDSAAELALLLIVPYGIETSCLFRSFQRADSF